MSNAELIARANQYRAFRAIEPRYLADGLIGELRDALTAADNQLALAQFSAAGLEVSNRRLSDIIAAQDKIIAALREALEGVMRCYRYDLTEPWPPQLIAARAALTLAEETERSE
jgi:hypothetical protein